MNKRLAENLIRLPSFFVHEALGATSVIPIRGLDRSGILISGHYRRKQKRDFETMAYTQRAKIETDHSVKKRKMGDIIPAKSAGRQHR